jgi:CheY-like chemotaxis protein
MSGAGVRQRPRAGELRGRPGARRRRGGSRARREPSTSSCCSTSAAAQGRPRRARIDATARRRATGARATARDALADRIAGLDAGADDYLAKPFELASSRHVCALARASGRAAPTIELPGVTIDPSTEVRVDGAAVALSAREYALLEALSARPGAILSRAQLEERLYG